ncbi:MAG: CDP-archaeol synthase, partial [Erysipelotrichaceae bacterium]
HKLIERISPKKTIEGSISGTLCSIIVSVIFMYFFLDLQNLGVEIILAVFIPVVAQIGDLSFSVVKRHFDIKDFGKLLPGHGGILDRLDSLLFTLVFVFTVIKMMEHFV